MLYFPQPEVTGHVSITLVYVMPDRRKRDLDNYLKPVLDALTECNIIEDDSKIVSLNIYKHPFAEKPGAVHIDVDSEVDHLFDKFTENQSAEVIQFPGRKH